MPGIIEAKTLRTEQYEFEARTTDPANAEPGEYWIRTDQTSSNPDVIAELRRQDTSGVTKIPLFDSSEESNLGSEMARGPSVVLDDGTVGFVAMAADSGAAIGSPRAVNASGTEYLSHNSLTLATIPDKQDLHARWDATEISASDTDSISTSSDQTGNGFDLTAGTAPTYRTDIINGNPVVRFNGSSEYLDVAFSELSQPNTIFVVAKTRSDGSSEEFHDSENGSGRHDFFSANGNYNIFAGSVLAGSTDDTNPHIFSELYDSTSSALRVDGSETTGDAGTGALNGFTVGSNYNQSSYGSVDIGEILIYPQEKSSIYSNVESYLSDKWGISI